MSTTDVPGANPANGDDLKMGCWAETDDGSLLFVESTENGRVVYSVFDTAKSPIIEYRDSMAEDAFKTTFTSGTSGTSRIVWTWHDKTGFPWDRVIKLGAREGGRLASADDIVDQGDDVAISRSRMRRRQRRTAAEQVADEWDLDPIEVAAEDLIRRSRREGGVSERTKRFADGLATLLEQHFGRS